MNMYLYTSLIAASIVSFVISTTICPFGKKLFKDDPRASNSISELRQMHAQYIPRIGGLGIIIAFWVTITSILLLRTGLGANYFLSDQRLPALFWIAGLSSAAFGLGFLDDIFEIRARYKLLIQLVIALIASLTILPLDVVYIPFIGSVKLGPLGIFVATIWIVGVMNAFNLIDGLDSLAGGIAFIALLGLAIQSWVSNDLMFFTLSITLMCAICGFLIYNFYPAKVFMGDGGALFLGFLLAVLPLLQIKTPSDPWSITPIFLLGVPLVDTAFSMIRRFIRGIPLFSADRNHIHHKLIAKGLTHRQAVRRLHLVSLIYMTVFLLSVQNLIPLKLGLISFLGISWLLVFFAGYEELVKPIDVIMNRGNLREDRSFLVKFSQNIEMFLKAANTQEELLFIVNIWSKEFGLLGYCIEGSQNIFEKSFKKTPEKPEEIKTLTYENDSLKVTLSFDREFFDLDSDIKLKCIKHAMTHTLHFLSVLIEKGSQPSKIVDLTSRQTK